MEYDRYTDEELIGRLQSGDRGVMNYIMEKYKGMVRKNAMAMYLLGGEKADLIQEGMIGLFEAVQNYRPEMGGSFSGFADLCVSRQLYSAVRAAGRKKHIPLNSYISLYGEDQGEDDQGRSLADTIEDDGQSNPEEVLLSREFMREFEEALKARLSSMESEVYSRHMKGMDYAGIARELGKSPKAVDNALQRIRGKARALLKEYEG